MYATYLFQEDPFLAEFSDPIHSKRYHTIRTGRYRTLPYRNLIKCHDTVVVTGQRVIGGASLVMGGPSLGPRGTGQGVGVTVLGAGGTSLGVGGTALGTGAAAPGIGGTATPPVQLPVVISQPQVSLVRTGIRVRHLCVCEC